MDMGKWLLGRILPKSLNQDVARIQNTVSTYQLLRSFNNGNASDQQAAQQLAAQIADAEHAYAALLLSVTKLDAVELVWMWISGGNEQLKTLRQQVEAAVSAGQNWLNQKHSV